MAYAITLDMTDRVAVVTGASRGIGRAIARMLGEAGATVVLAARDEAALAEAASEVEGAGGRAMVVATDVAERGAVEGLFEKVDAACGRVDVLVNNAGIGRFGAAADFSVQDFDAVMRVNLRGAFLCAQQAVRRMLAAERGMIVNIGSVVSFKGYADQAAYTASKHGLLGLTKSLAAETHGKGVRVSAVLPGGVDTEMVGDARPDLDRSVLMRPEDVAEAVAYLLSLPGSAMVDQIYIRRDASAPF